MSFIKITLLIIGGVIGTYYFYKDPKLGILSVLVLFFFDAFFKELPGLGGAISLYPADILFSFLAAVGVLRFFIPFQFKIFRTLWFIYGMINLFSLYRGIHENSIYLAGVEFRFFFYFWAGTFFFSTFNYSKIAHTNWPKLLIITSLALCGLAFVRWIADIALDMSDWRSFGGYGLRVHNAETTFFIAQCFFVLLFSTWHKTSPTMPTTGYFSTKVSPYLMSILIISIILLQHRTVWVCTMCIFILFLIRGDLSNSSLSKRLKISSLIFSGVLLLGLMSLFLKEDLLDALTESSSNLQTFLWRYEGWLNLLEGIDSPEKLFFGKSMGSGYMRLITTTMMSSSVVDVNPHNYYLTIVLRLGLIGLFILMFCWISITVKKVVEKKISEQLHFEGLMFNILGVSLFIFSITYGAHYEQCIWFGLALSYFDSAKENLSSSTL